MGAEHEEVRMSIYTLGGVAPELPEDGDYWVAPSASVIGHVRLEKGASIWFGAVLRGDNELILIGEGSNVQDLAVLHTDTGGTPALIGRHCVIGHQAMLHGCTVGDNSLIGIGSVILNKARIGSFSIVGANALVTEGKIFPDRSLILGSPAKVVRPITEQEEAMLKLVGPGYVANARRFKSGLKPDPRG
jgi:carbonic anhydrase/acetyltransferase-like protein (isoleucine patch superfamily)